MSDAAPADESALNRLQHAVLVHGLPDVGPTATLALDELTVPTVQHVAQWAAGQQLAGVFVDLLQSIDVDRRFDARGVGLLIGQMRTSLVCEATAVRVIEVLSAAGVDAWLIKGVPVAQIDYPDPAWRSTGDVDVLVARPQLHAAVEALGAAGFRRTEPPPRRGWEGRFARAVMLRSQHDVEVDLHVSIAPGYFGAALDHEMLVRDADRFTLGGVVCASLGGPARLLLSCYAAVLSRGSTHRYLRDLAQQLLVTGIDWRRSLELARSGDGESVLALAVTEAVGAGVVPREHPMAIWAATVSPSGRALLALRYADSGKGVGWIADARSQLMALSFLDGIRFVGGVALPPRGVRQGRGLTIGRQLRRGLRFARLRR